MGKHESSETVTTFEEAKKCPRCGQVGEEISQKPVRQRLQVGGTGATLHTIRCKTELCQWFDSDYYVQVNADGTIPLNEYYKNQEKVYPHTRITEKDRARFEQQLRLQIERETNNPRGPMR